MFWHSHTGSPSRNHIMEAAGGTPPVAEHEYSDTPSSMASGGLTNSTTDVSENKIKTT